MIIWEMMDGTYYRKRSLDVLYFDVLLNILL